MSAGTKVQQKTDIHKCAETMCNGFLMIGNKKHRPSQAGAFVTLNAQNYYEKHAFENRIYHLYTLNDYYLNGILYLLGNYQLYH